MMTLLRNARTYDYNSGLNYSINQGLSVRIIWSIIHFIYLYETAKNYDFLFAIVNHLEKALKHYEALYKCKCYYYLAIAGIYISKLQFSA